MSNDDAKLFVAGLPDSISEDVVKEMFQSTGGTVLQVSLPRNRDTGRPRGIGFVTMGSAAEAEAARGALDGSLQMGRSILVRPYQADPPKRDGVGGGPGMGGGGGFGGGGPRFGGGGPRPGGGPPSQDRQIFVGNIPYDCTQADVEGLINSVAEGQVVRVHLPTEADGRIRGFGFVTMSSPEAAAAAIELLKEGELRGRRLSIKLAQPKADRPARPDGFAAAAFGPPPPPPGPVRRSFDDKKKKTGGSYDDGPKKRRFEGGGGGGGRGGGGGGRIKDWGDDD
ncbi:MAG: RNA-binding protein [Polyangiaceae bacterium]